MAKSLWRNLPSTVAGIILAVPVRLKIIGIMMLPILILGFALNFWIQSGLSDWLSWLLDSNRVAIAMQAGGRSVMLVTALAALLSVALTFVLMLTLTRPLLELHQVATRVAQGELESRARVWAKDEIGQVAQSVNAMIDRLVHGQKQLQQTNRRLSALYRVTSAVGTGLDLGKTLDAALMSTLDVMKLQAGWIYLREPDSERFRLATAAALPAGVADSSGWAEHNLCACQRALLAGEMQSAAAMRECEQLRPAPEGGEEPLRHLSLPLAARGECFGVLNLLWPHDSEPSQPELELLSAIGVQISEAVANAWLHANVREKEAARQALLSALVRAQEDERARVARELHDGAGQSLTSLLVQLKALESRADPTHLGPRLSDMCTAVSHTIEQVRDLSHRLRPPALEELGLEVALSALVDDMVSQAGLEAEFRSSLGGQRLPPDVETTIYRIAQEALTNALRHSRARKVSIELKGRGHMVHFAVEDDGVGFDADATVRDGRDHLGLASIQERAEILGGSVVVHSAPDAGTCLEVHIPVPVELPAGALE